MKVEYYHTLHKQMVSCLLALPLTLLYFREKGKRDLQTGIHLQYNANWLVFGPITCREIYLLW